MNNALHTTRFHVWWEHQDGAIGKRVRSTKEFKRKEEAAVFIRKTPHLVKYPDGAGCYMESVAKEVARDGKVRTTTIRQDIWTFGEMVQMIEEATDLKQPRGRL